MKDKHSDIAYLKSIMDAIEMIALHQQSPLPNYTVNHAVVFDLVTIGEAAAKLSDAIRKRNPQVEWSLIIAARNRMVHGYMEIDYDIVWNIVENFLPDLRTDIAAIIATEENGNTP